MTALQAEWQKVETRPESQPDVGDFAFLNHLRLAALQCRCKPKTNLFQACALLHVDKVSTLEAHSEALMRCLREALGKPARVHAPGTKELSFDEAWLLQMGQAVLRNDQSSLRFLLRSRVGPEHQRLIGFLIRRISEHFPPN